MENTFFINVKGTEFEEDFDKDMVSLEDFYNKALDFKCERDEWKEKYEDEREQREEFYKPKSPYEVYGVCEKNFI